MWMISPNQAGWIYLIRRNEIQGNYRSNVRTENK